MATLYLGTPHKRALEGARSFEEVEAKEIGRAYALSEWEAQTLRPGDKVVVVRKRQFPSRVEGNLVKIEFTGSTTGNSLRRYDVYIEGLKRVEYHPGPNLTHRGVLLVV